MVQLSYLSIFLLENEISFTTTLNDLIFCKLDVIPYTLFFMRKVLSAAAKIGDL